ncbi:MAG: hypothetical protein ACRD3T_02950 [Terriglobia bacterium]
MRNVEMCGLLNNRKTAVWLIAMALAALGLLGVNPVHAASRHPGGLALRGPTASHASLSRFFAAGMAGEAKRPPEANEGTRRAPEGAAQATSPLKLRDPFKAPEPPPVASTGKGKVSRLPAVLPPGVRGLLIDQLVLEGVVDKKPDNTMIAVVTNKTNRAYFLRVNEQVFDGTVTLITPAAIYFRQRYYTQDDKAEWRTVEKRLSPGPEGTK